MFARNQSQLDENIVQLLHQGGHLKPTPLQEKIIPLILKGKDIAVEAEDRTGKTASFVIPILSKLEGEGGTIKALAIASSFENAKKIFKEFRKYIRPKHFQFSLLLLGDDAMKREEYRVLSKGPDIVIGTPKSIIDHIRRGNFSFEKLQYVVIDVPGRDELESFRQDIHFIMHKLPDRRQTILYSRLPLSSIDAVLQVLKRPMFITRRDWKSGTYKHRLLFYPVDDLDEKAKFELVERVFIARGITSLLVFCNKRPAAMKLRDFLKRKGHKVEYHSGERDDEDRLPVVKKFNNGSIDTLVSSHLAVLKERYAAPTHVIHFDMPENIEEYESSLLTDVEKTEEVINFIHEAEFQTIQQSEEIKRMNPKLDNLPTDDEVLAGHARQIIKNIGEDANVDDLVRYVKLVKKNVPLFSRSNFAAYLFRELYGTKRSGSGPRGGSHSAPRSTPRGPFAPAPSAGPSTASKDAVTLFISTGRNRKVFPQDLITLFTGVAGIKRADIREIKVLDNYSFLDIATQYADTAIGKLDGSEFKGKKITVNYARKKEMRPKR